MLHSSEAYSKYCRGSMGLPIQSFAFRVAIDLDTCTLHASVDLLLAELNHRFNLDFSQWKRKAYQVWSQLNYLAIAAFWTCKNPVGCLLLSIRFIREAVGCVSYCSLWCRREISIPRCWRSIHKEHFNIIWRTFHKTDRYWHWVFFPGSFKGCYCRSFGVEVVVLSAEDWTSTYEDLRFWLLHTLLVQGSCTVLLGGPWYESVVYSILAKLVPNKPDWHKLSIWHL